MNINLIVLGVLFTLLGLYSWKAYTTSSGSTPNFLPWVPIQVGKQRSFVNQTRDAGMHTEWMRRAAIISNPRGVYSYKGSTNGSLEWNFLTSICVCPLERVCPFHPTVDDGGNATSDVCDYLDGNGDEVFDSGDAGPKGCDLSKSGCQTFEIDDAGNATAEFCDYLDGNGNEVFDGGKADVNLCDL